MQCVSCELCELINTNPILTKEQFATNQVTLQQVSNMTEFLEKQRIKVYYSAKQIYKLWNNFRELFHSIQLWRLQILSTVHNIIKIWRILEKSSVLHCIKKLWFCHCMGSGTLLEIIVCEDRLKHNYCKESTKFNCLLTITKLFLV